LRVAVIGNCQSAGFLDCLLAYLPGTEGVLFDLTALGPMPGALARSEAIAAGLDGFTHVFAHRLYGERFGPLDWRQLGQRPNVIPVPVIAFQGFHPDCIYLQDGERQLIGPMGVYHSALAAVAFTLGLPPDRTTRLFNPLVLRRLGYLEAHADAVARMARHFAELDHDVLPRLETWQRDRAFMHTVNHPRLIAIADTCRMVLARAGLGEHELAEADIVADRLAQQPVFPVYPPIARPLGIPGSWTFRGLLRRDHPLEAMTLDTFVARSHAAYAAEPEAVAAAVSADPRAQRVATVLPRLLDRVA
jgi:hypothetical protein